MIFQTTLQTYYNQQISIDALDIVIFNHKKKVTWSIFLPNSQYIVRRYIPQYWQAAFKKL